MQIHVAGPFEPPDNPLPTADPAIAPMRRPCMERGCQYRNRALVYGGWLLAVLDLLANVAIVHDWVQVSRAQAAAIVERDALRAELAVRQVPRPPVVAVPAPPPAEPVRARPRPKSVSDVPPPVPESEKKIRDLMASGALPSAPLSSREPARPRRRGRLAGGSTIPDRSHARSATNRTWRSPTSGGGTVMVRVHAACGAIWQQERPGAPDSRDKAAGSS